MDAFLTFLLSCFLGYYIVSNVFPSLHSPLIAMTNAVSSIIVISGIELYILRENCELSSFFSCLAIFILFVNVIGGLLITNRMLKLFDKDVKSDN